MSTVYAPSLNLHFESFKGLTNKIRSGMVFTRAGTATYVDQDGLVKTESAGVLRHEYSPTGGYRGVLLEEARTNICLQSETFDNASWTKTNASAGANAIVAPDGNTTADSLIDTGTNAAHEFHQDMTYVANSFLSFSVWAKAGARNFLAMRVDSSNGFQATFDLSTGTISTALNAFGTGSITGTFATIVAYPNGWYRCTISGKSAAATTVSSAFLYAGNVTGNQPSYAGSTTAAIYLWGAQFEVGAFGTSYIPTVGSTGSRIADALSIPLSAFTFNANYGTLVAAFDTAYAANIPYVLDINDGTTNNRTSFIINSTAMQLVNVSATSSTATINPTGTIANNTYHTFAGSYSAAAYACCTQGNTVATSGAGALPVSPTTLNIGSRASVAQPLNGTIKHIAYWPRVLSSAELQAVTI